MKLLVVTQYFWPETFIIQDLVRTLSEQGHSVVVLTGKPNYPGGNVFLGYEEASIQKETYAGCIEVNRVPLRARRRGAVNLFRNYLSFVWSGIRWFPKMVKGRDVDAILVFAPSPITAAIPAIYLKWRKKAHLALWIQDLWPESLYATGYIRNPLALVLVGHVVRWIYRMCDTLLIQSRAFYDPVARYGSEEKIVYYPNSIDGDINRGNDGVCDELPSALIDVLDSHFCVVFAGNIGKAQSIPTLIEAARQLKDMSDVKFILVGSGSMLDWAREQQVSLGLSNLVLAGRFSMGVMPDIYRRASALVVTLTDEAIFAQTIPSKVQAYLAAAKPIIGALNGEGARVIQEAQAGLTSPAEDSEALARCVRTIYEMSSEDRNLLGAAGRRYFETHFEMRSQAKRLIEVLTQRIEKTGSNN